MKTKSLTSKNIALSMIIAGLIYWLWSGTAVQQPWNARKALYYDAALDAEPLIRAIGEYTAYYGSPPKELGSLVPKFIEEIPGTGLEGCNRFKYANYGSSRISVLWYDLGSRHGQPVSKESQYSDGDPGHSILAFTIGERDTVVDAKLDRMPKEFQPMEFDAEQWLTGTNRIAMAPGLPEDYEFGRMPQSVLQKLLGPPDGVRVLRDTPWELRINCPRGFMDREVFFYWPTERYPEQIYGGKTELVGRWLYVH